MNAISKILKETKVIAVVGLSPDPERDSYRVAKYLKGKGYRIIPVNPNINQILGEKSYSSLSEVSEKVDIVDVFRRPEFVPEIVDDAIKIGAKFLWLQLGVVHEEAAAKARTAGLEVVMDRCIMVDHRNLAREAGPP